MTKTIVFHENCLAEQPKKKPIEFHKLLNSRGEIKLTTLKPKDFNNVVLIGPNYNWPDPTTSDPFDVMFAYNDKNPSEVTVFIGLWNDGVSE